MSLGYGKLLKMLLVCACNLLSITSSFFSYSGIQCFSHRTLPKIALDSCLASNIVHIHNHIFFDYLKILFICTVVFASWLNCSLHNLQTCRERQSEKEKERKGGRGGQKV